MAFSSLLLVHFVSFLFFLADPSSAVESSFHPAASAGVPAVIHHFILIVHEGDDQDLVCLANGRSPNAHSLWLKNGVELEDGEVATLSSMQGQDSLFRSTLTIRKTEPSDNGIYTCILIDETGKSWLKSYDLLVTDARPVVSEFSNQTAITTIIGVMTALIVLMAIATALTYRAFCVADKEQLLEARRASSTSVISQVPDGCFVIGTEQKDVPPVLHV